MVLSLGTLQTVVVKNLGFVHGKPRLAVAGIKPGGRKTIARGCIAGFAHPRVKSPVRDESISARIPAAPHPAGLPIGNRQSAIGYFVGLSICLASLALGQSSPAADSHNPYQGIAERNIFHLTPVPPPAAPPPAAGKPLPKIFLTGLTTLDGKRALFKATAPAKPGEAPKPKYYCLPEGGSQDDIQVLAIDEAAGTARLNCTGTEITVNLKDKEPAPPAGAVVSLVPRPPARLAAAPTVNQPDAGMEDSPSGVPASPAPFIPHIIPTAPPILSQAATPADESSSGRQPGYDEHGL